MCLKKERDVRHGVLHAGMVIEYSNHTAGFMDNTLRRISRVLVRSAEGYGGPVFGNAPASGGEVIALVSVENFHCSTVAGEQ